MTAARSAAGAKVEVNGSWVHVVLGGRVDVTDSRVSLGPVQALGFGAGLGIVAVLVHLLFHRTMIEPHGDMCRSAATRHQQVLGATRRIGAVSMPSPELNRGMSG